MSAYDDRRLQRFLCPNCRFTCLFADYETKTCPLCGHVPMIMDPISYDVPSSDELEREAVPTPLEWRRLGALLENSLTEPEWVSWFILWALALAAATLAFYGLLGWL